MQGDVPTVDQASHPIKFLPVQNHPTLPTQQSEKSLRHNPRPKQRGTESMPVFYPVRHFDRLSDDSEPSKPVKKKGPQKVKRTIKNSKIE